MKLISTLTLKCLSGVLKPATATTTNPSVTVVSVRQFGQSPTTLKQYRVSVDLNEKQRDVALANGYQPGVVFLFGWTGSRVKHLDRYSEIYEKRGEAVVKYCPTPYFIYKPHVRKDYLNGSRELIDLLSEKGLERKPLFFHSFSNGGAYMYYAVCNQLANSGTPIRGSVFDSTPARSGYYLIKGSAAQVTPGNELIKSAVGFLVWSYCELFLRYKYLSESLSMKDTSKTEDYRYFLHRSLLAQPNLGPQLCLFSKTDDVTFYKDVLDFVEERKSRGVDVEAKMWEESRHIKHILDHTDEYLNLVEIFFDKCRSQKNYAVAPQMTEAEAVLCRSKS